MKLSTSVLLAVVTLGAAQKGVGKGSGPYKAHYYEEPSLPKHVFYAPTSQPPGLKLPVLIWGNGGCSGNGTSSERMAGPPNPRPFLTRDARYALLEVAKRGFKSR
jgi:hypothetical protein